MHLRRIGVISLFAIALATVLFLIASTTAVAQSTATLQGTVTDPDRHRGQLSGGRSTGRYL
jgi:hypothetical protein